MDIEIRDALAGDAEALSPLMGQLMHQPSKPAQIRLRLQRLARTGADRILVAVVQGALSVWPASTSPG
jgi:uncharacterized membrane protein YhfC